MKQILSFIKAKAPLLLLGVSLCAILALFKPMNVAADGNTVNASSFANGTVNTSDLATGVNIVLDADLTININEDKTIGNITHDLNCWLPDSSYDYTLKITGNSENTLHTGYIYTEDTTGKPRDHIIIESGNISTGYIAMLTITIKGGNLSASSSSELRSEIVKARQCSWDNNSGNIKISGGTVNVYNTGSHAIYGRKLIISGSNTVIDVTSGLTAGGTPLYATNGITIAAPLEVTTPTGGGLHADGKFVTNTPGTTDLNDYPHHVVISRGSGSANSDCESSNGGKGSSKKDAHVHTYSWVVTKEPTAYVNGEMVYKCTTCGHIAGRAPVEACSKIITDGISKLSGAEQGATVTLDFGNYYSINKAFATAHDARPDVTTIITYYYKGVHYEITIPAGFKLLSTLDSNGWAGFKYIETFPGITSKVIQ